ncbi:MAG: NAD(P)/FAD-dependent oxidoreductase [Bryobacteraceae bacterium]
MDILGAGPAGLAAALSLKQLAPEARVTVLDAARPAHRRPGETLSPPAQSILTSLGCWQAFQAEGFPESFGSRAVWGSDEPYENEFLFSLHGNGWHLDRTRFDSMLARCARAAGVEIRDAEAWNGSGNFIIDASGRPAAFAIAQGAARHVADALVGVFAVLELAQNCDSYTLVEAQEDGWWYSSMLGDSRAMAAWMSDADLVRNAHLHDPACWSTKLAAAKFTSRRLRDARPLHAPVIHAAQSQCLSVVAGSGWVAAGDAAMTLDPLSSQGILQALRSGKLASFVAFDYLQGRASTHERYAQIVKSEYEAYEKTRREFYSTERRWQDSPFWLRRR